jgi:hypothetical protein
MRKLLIVLALVVGHAPGADAVVRVDNKQAFDKCFVPTINQMQRWWDSSPYWNVNVYIGGSARACGQSNLTANWVATTHAQGWNFIPTWVGPQAPCAGFGSSISWNTATARSQGIAEADKAINAATALGFTSPMIIYYDMEGYPDDWACYNAVNSFMDGWGARMRARGHRAGGYGSACASGMQAWGDITNWPHTAWMAHWLYSSYRAGANVWNVACVPNSYWDDHQRIRQYAGDHNEVWGGVTFTIDSNAVDGLVQGSNPHTALVAPTADLLAPVPPRSLVEQFATRPAGDVQAVHANWVATTTPPNANGYVTLAMHRTRDRGVTWSTSTIHTFRMDDGNLIAGPVWIDAVDNTGYVAVRLASSANFSRGMLFRTSDGGATWQQRTLPIGSRVRFVDADNGWTAGGPAGNQLFATHDGGQTWSLVDGIDPNETVFQDVPTFTTDRDGVLPVTVASATNPRVHLYVTSDKGETWTLARAVPLAGEPGARVPVAIADAATWIVVDPATDKAHFTGPSGDMRSESWPPNVVEIDFDSALVGTIQSAAGECTGSKATGTFACDQTRRLLHTTDGGRTWSADAPLDDGGDEEVTTTTTGGCNAGDGAGGLALLGFAFVALLLGGRFRRRV